MGLDTVELVLETEKHFSVSLPDEALAEIETVESFCKLIRTHCLQKNGVKSPSYSDIYQYVIQLLHPYSKFVKDLGLD